MSRPVCYALKKPPGKGEERAIRISVIIRFLCAAAAFTLFAAPVSAQPTDTKVITVSPSWNTFTNADGTGLYFDIMHAVFTGLYGMEVEHRFVPSLRAVHLVEKGQADIMTCKELAPAGLILAKNPMYENAYHVFFNRKNIGPWRGRESLSGRSVAWRISYYSARNVPEGMRIKEVKDGSTALSMVLRGHIDFYLDDKTLIKETIAASDSIFDPNDYDVQPVGFRSYHPVFNTSDRGEWLIRLYDEGMDTLHAKGLLKPIFDKWGHPYPRYGKYGKTAK